jgi:hypothetical protein
MLKTGRGGKSGKLKRRIRAGNDTRGEINYKINVKT